MNIYFLEIKNRLLLLILTGLSTVVVCYIFKEILFFMGIKHIIYLKIFQKELSYFIFTDVSEIFSVYIVLIFFISNQVILFCLFYHILIFLLPGLYYYESIYFLFLYKTSLYLFVFSIFVCNKFLFSLCWDFLLSFQNFEVLKLTALYFESKISEYFLFHISLYYTCVFYFQILIIIFIIFDFLYVKEIIIFKNFRKIFYYIFFIFSTFITPPDIFSQLYISLFFIFSYEILVFYYICSKIYNNL